MENFRLMDVPHKMVILGDMKELGESSLEEHQKVLSQLEECAFERVILVGSEFGRTGSSYEHYLNIDEVKVMVETEKLQGKYILIKGSNSKKLSQLKDIL